MQPPFTADQFLDVFLRYNAAVWPMQAVFYAVAAGMVLLAAYPRPGAGRAVSALLALLWAWMAVAYHWGFFAALNPAARLFGAFFLLQAALFAGEGVARGRLAFRLRGDVAGVLGGVLAAYALLAYPVLGALAGHPFPRGPTLGLPCPTTIFTFAVLLWSERPPPGWLLAVPLAWSLVGASAALSLGMVEDAALPAAGVLATAVLAGRAWRARRGAGGRAAHA